MMFNEHLYSVYFAPRGANRMAELGRDIAQLHLRPQDQLIGIIGDAGSGKSMLIKGMFPGLELTNDDEGVNIRPLPLLDMLDDPLGGGLGKAGFSLFATPHTYHIDIRFEQGFTQTATLAQAILSAVKKGKRVVIEHYELVYPFMKLPESSLPVNADLLIGIGEEVLVTRPNLFGPLPDDIANVSYKSLIYRKMAHSAEDLTTYFLGQQFHEDFVHGDVRHGFVLAFREKPMLNLERLEQRVLAAIEQDVPISFVDEEHIKIGDAVVLCTGPRNHVKSAGKIQDFTLIKELPYDPISGCYLLVGLVGHRGEAKVGEDIDKIRDIY